VNQSELNKEVRLIRHKVSLINKNGKSIKIFLPLGILMIIIGFYSMIFIITYWDNLINSFFVGFLLMLIIITGYSLLHKSVRGAWL